MRAMGFAGAVLLWAMTTSQASGALLTSGYETQLETWLGQGNLDFTNIFTKVAGDQQYGPHFHLAADGKGATFTLIEVIAINYAPLSSSIVIGGYNPLSWDFTVGTFNSYTDAERTAFIFNLTTLELRRQKLLDDLAGPFAGQYQTTSFYRDGPRFGSGYDIYIGETLTMGMAQTQSYGENLATGSESENIMGRIGNEPLEYGRIEVYTFAPAAISPSAVPEPASCLMAGLAGLGLVVGRRKRRTRSAA